MDKKPVFPLLGPKTGIYIPLFWADRYPKYRDWCYELIGHIKDAADVIVLVTDDTITDVPEGVIQVKTDEPVTIWGCFSTVVEEMAKRDVGAFHFVAADNAYRPENITGLIEKCMTEADVAYGGFEITNTRDFKATPVAKYDEMPFNVDRHTWTDAACFRTSIFTQFPITGGDNHYLLRSLTAARDKGMEPVGRYYPEYSFFYHQWHHLKLDRSFLGECTL